MAFRATLPFEIRLEIYEFVLAGWLDEPAIFSTQGTTVRVSRVLESTYKPISRVSVPAVLQAEAGEARYRLLTWLAKYRCVVPAERAPTLRFPDRELDVRRDFYFLQSHNKMLDISSHIMWLDRNGVTREISSGLMPRRIALLSPTCYGSSLPLLLNNFKLLWKLEELAFAFVELDHGELKFIDSAPKMDPSAYRLEPIRDGDIPAHRRRLTKKIEGLEELIRSMLSTSFWMRPIKITACKMIPRI